VAILASNSSQIAGKWFPYYHKPFILGRVGDGQGSTDGNTYIEQTAGGADNTILNGICFSSHNCGYYYRVVFKNSSTDEFLVEKYDLKDNLIDSIEATSGYNWDLIGGVGLITIDIGVAIYFASSTTAEALDNYKITLPSADTMDRRKIYHGGYSTFMRMPATEGISHHSDIIPCDLKNKNISVSFNTPMFQHIGSGKTLEAAISREDSMGNLAVSASLEWNINPDGANSNVAVANYGWDSGETWSLGTQSAYDVDPNSDFPIHAHLSSSDLSTSSPVSGTFQTQNIQVSGRAGHAKFRLEFEPGTGGPAILANNQFWPVILTIS
jgi:hypothetical protein